MPKDPLDWSHPLLQQVAQLAERTQNANRDVLNQAINNVMVQSECAGRAAKGILPCDVEAIWRAVSSLESPDSPNARSETLPGPSTWNNAGGEVEQEEGTTAGLEDDWSAAFAVDETLPTVIRSEADEADPMHSDRWKKFTSIFTDTEDARVEHERCQRAVEASFRRLQKAQAKEQRLLQVLDGDEITGIAA